MGRSSASERRLGHSSYIGRVELGVKAAVKRLCLFHNEPTYDDERLAGLLRDTREYLPSIITVNPTRYHRFAYDGMELEV